MKEEKQFINAIFKANESVRIVQVRKKEGWRQKQLTGLFFKGKVPNHFVLQSKVKQHEIRMKEGYRFSREDECRISRYFC